MRIIRKLLLAASSMALVTLLGCVQICDQRITMRYDRDSDTFTILLHYDGVHDSGSDQWGKGVDQLAKFVEGGQIMLLDWPLQIDLNEIRSRANDSNVPANERAVDKVIADQVKIESVGRYRDAMGRIGGAQLITVTKASVLVRSINTAINAEIRSSDLADTFPADANLSGTRERILAAAEKDHQWLAIEGDALRVSVPVHDQEWAAQKAKGLYSLLVETREAFATNDAEKIRELEDMFVMLSHSLANVPFAYGESDGIVTLRLGDPARPATIRVQGLNKYDDTLEAELERLVTQDVDQLMARQLADGKVEPASAGLTAIVEWGPPEERVRAAARAAQSEDVALARRSYLWLRDFGADWNHRHNLPKMPVSTDDSDHTAFARACLDWCRDVREFPNPRPAAGEPQPVLDQIKADGGVPADTR